MIADILGVSRGKTLIIKSLRYKIFSMKNVFMMLLYTKERHGY